MSARPAQRPHSPRPSFRDPSGFIFTRHGTIFRQINKVYAGEYEHFMACGLYQQLVQENLLIPHHEVEISPEQPAIAHKIIQPETIPFISYPYEWCPSQLLDAALLTLRIQRIALQYDMSLKDCSAFNIQFLHGKPIFIDTLSFERYREGTPWVPYRQFCQHFLAPLALMHYRDLRLGALFLKNIDGLPLDMVVNMLPPRSMFNVHLFMHLHLHAKAQQRTHTQRNLVTQKVSRSAHLGLIDSLEAAVKKLHPKKIATAWSDYYQDTNYTPTAFAYKKQILASILDEVKPNTVWDLGTNTGEFSQIATARQIFCVGMDADPGAVEIAYRKARQRGDSFYLPLVIDLINPTPAIGWNNDERMSFVERGPAQMVLALALIHHLAIGNNLPLPMIAEFLAKITNWLVVEFVPKEDSQVQRMLAFREDIFPDYEESAFQESFSRYFDIRQRFPLPESKRSILLGKRTI